MTLEALIRRAREAYDGFNAPARAADLKRLQKAVGELPEDVLHIYRDHNGSGKLPHRANTFLPARLLPIDEAIETNRSVAEVIARAPRLGPIVWLWTDDNSNLVGTYTSGPFAGWLVKYGHEEPSLEPVYRSAVGFLSRLLDAAPVDADDDSAAYDLVMVPCELPASEDDPGYVEADRKLAATFRGLYENEADDELRRLYARCAMCLTPVRDTASIVPFLSDPDMWTPESAVRLMEIRAYDGAIRQLEQLARNGQVNGDSAAMRLLVRLGAAGSEAAIARLQTELTGQKRQMLNQWLRGRDRLQPPRWP